MHGFCYILFVLLFLFSLHNSLQVQKTTVSLWAVQKQATGCILLTLLYPSNLKFSNSLFITSIFNSWDLCFGKSCTHTHRLSLPRKLILHWSYFLLVSACFLAFPCGSVSHRQQGSRRDRLRLQAVQRCVGEENFSSSFLGFFFWKSSNKIYVRQINRNKSELNFVCSGTPKIGESRARWTVEACLLPWAKAPECGPGASEGQGRFMGWWKEKAFDH